MAHQTSEGRTPLKNSVGQSSRITGSYVRNVAGKLEEQISESGSERTLLDTRRSHKMCISFSLHGQPGADCNWKGTLSRGTDDSPPENVTDAADSRYDESQSRKASDAKSASPSVVSKSVSYVQTVGFVSSNVDTDHHSTPIRSVAKLKIAACRDVPVETNSANTSAASSFRSG